jgi:uroporphyrin-III C-methyltransferase
VTASPGGDRQAWLDPGPEESGFARLDAAAFPSFEPGWVWLVGAGPGAPGLLTLLAYHALQSADIVIYDALVNPDVIRWVRPGCQVEYAGKRGGKPSAKQRDISLRLVELAKGGQRVLRLKGGDPFIFGRGAEECQTLARAGVPFRIVPGISSGAGGLAYAGIPATHRDTNHSVIFLTGHDATGEIPAGVDWRAVATASPVIVMYMAMKNLPGIAEKFLAFGRSPEDPLTIVSRVSLPDQSVRETTLGDASRVVREEGLPTPAIIVIGKVAELRGALDWYAGGLRENSLG